MTKTIQILFAFIFGFGVLSCTGITDFSNPETGKIVIGDILDESVPLAVQLNNDMASISLEFIDPLPVDDQDNIYDLIGDAVTLLIRKNSNMVGVSLTDSPVNNPNEPGEYSVNFSDDGRTMTIDFYNETLLGQTLRTDEEYLCLIEVTIVNDYFETGLWVYDVEVSD